MPPHIQAVATRAVDDSEATLNLEQRTWTFTACIQTAFLTFTTPFPQSYARILPYPHVHYLMVNIHSPWPASVLLTWSGGVISICLKYTLFPFLFSYITTHHNIIYTSCTTHHTLSHHPPHHFLSHHLLYNTNIHTLYSQPLQKTAADCGNNYIS